MKRTQKQRKTPKTGDWKLIFPYSLIPLFEKQRKTPKTGDWKLVVSRWTLANHSKKQRKTPKTGDWKTKRVSNCCINLSDRNREKPLKLGIESVFNSQKHRLSNYWRNREKPLKLGIESCMAGYGKLQSNLPKQRKTPKTGDWKLEVPCEFRLLLRNETEKNP